MALPSDNPALMYPLTATYKGSGSVAGADS